MSETTKRIYKVIDLHCDDIPRYSGVTEEWKNDLVSLLHNEVLKGKIEGKEIIEELVNLIDDIRDGNYEPDSFTTQPAKIYLADLQRQIKE